LKVKEGDDIGIEHSSPVENSLPVTQSQDIQFNRNTPTASHDETKDLSLYYRFYEQVETAAQNSKGPDYVDLSETDLSHVELPVKLIAFYLPQFHPIPENDLWWGKGFTEWTNVSKAIPQFLGHYQPRLPGELGFYDLRVPEVQQRQVELARKYGIYGFCFYYYWFDGKRLLERPLDQFVSNPNINFPFCLCWANENWTRRWDGLENEILIAQVHSEENDYRIIQDLELYFTHPNYIRIEGRPLFIVYRAHNLADPIGTAYRWRQYCREKGLPEPYLVAAQTFGFEDDPRNLGFDAAVEFPPHGIVIPESKNLVNLLNPKFPGKIYDYIEAVKYSVKKQVPNFKLFRTAMTSWDNTPRKLDQAHLFLNSEPFIYSMWLSSIVRHTLQHFSNDERLVFINAWNEWAEGAYLEPDRKYGYAYLQSTANVLKAFTKHTLQGNNKKSIQKKILKKTSDTAVILHLYYLEMWDEICSYLENLNNEFDFFITVPDTVQLREEQILSRFPNAQIFYCENRGRDIAPFIKVLRMIYPENYRYILKIHTKRSLHRQDGFTWSQDLLGKILGSYGLVNIKKALDQEDIGVVAPEGHVLPSHLYWHMRSNKENVEILASLAGISFEEGIFPFVAGSMFWFKPKALEALLSIDINEDDFEFENNQIDGTLAHAIERFLGLLVIRNGYRIVEVSKDGIVTEANYLERKNYPFAMPTTDIKPSIGILSIKFNRSDQGVKRK